MRIEGEEPRVYQEGSCFWFDESYTHEVDHIVKGSESLRVQLYLDALHPSYYAESHEVEVGHRQGSVGAWQDLLVSHDMTLPGGGSAPHVYRVEPPVPRNWVWLAETLQKDNADTCILGDQGALFHEVAFGRGGEPDLIGVALLTGIFRRAESFIANRGTLDRKSSGGSTGFDLLLAGMRSLTSSDILMMRNDIWSCLGLGCGGCRPVLVTGLCVEGFSHDERSQLLDSFAVMMRIDPERIRRWFQFMGFESPPPLDWGLSPAEIVNRVQTRHEEVLQILAL